MSDKQFRTQQIVIKKNDPRFAELDALCLASRYLYNQANYRMRKAMKEKNYTTIDEIQKQLTAENHPAYRGLPARLGNQTLRRLKSNWNSFFKALKAESKGQGRAKWPKYLKDDARYLVIVPRNTIRKTQGDKGWLSFVGLSHDLMQLPSGYKKLHQVRLVPRTEYIVVELVYVAKKNPSPKPSHESKKQAGIDLGIDNLATVSVDDPHVRPLIVDGKQAKSWNVFTHKTTSRLKSSLSKDTYTSKTIGRVWDNRNRRMKAYMHWASRQIVDYCHAHGVDTIIIGWNPGWKSDKSDMGKKFNQRFRSLPLGKLVELIEYKAAELGITVIKTEESYTSKTSVLHGELPHKMDTYQARRKHRGLLVSKDGCGTSLNADVNGACQIVRKRNPEAFTWAEGLEGNQDLFRPVKVCYGRSLPSDYKHTLAAQR